LADCTEMFIFHDFTFWYLDNFVKNLICVLLLFIENLMLDFFFYSSKLSSFFLYTKSFLYKTIWTRHFFITCFSYECRYTCFARLRTFKLKFRQFLFTDFKGLTIKNLRENYNWRSVGAFSAVATGHWRPFLGLRNSDEMIFEDW